MLASVAVLPDPGTWALRGACRGHDPELFFPAAASASAEAQTRRAKTVCGRCTVRAICLDYALATSQDWGVWGGASAAERRAILRVRRRERLARREGDQQAMGDGSCQGVP